MKELRKKQKGNDKYINCRNLKLLKMEQRCVYNCIRAGILLCELDAKLCEVFARGGQIVSDDGHILLNVHDD